MAHDVFISYQHQDKAIADAACAKLEDGGVRCWIAPRDVPPGAEWAASIVEAIDQCRVLVLIFSTHANRSKQVHREAQRAFDGEKPVVPFRIENVPPERSLAYYMGSNACRRCQNWGVVIPPGSAWGMPKTAQAASGMEAARSSM